MEGIAHKFVMCYHFDSVFDALGGKYKGGLAPLYSRKIKKLREKRQLTQKQLAELSGISESALRSYELGDRKPYRVSHFSWYGKR